MLGEQPGGQNNLQRSLPINMSITAVISLIDLKYAYLLYRILLAIKNRHLK